MEGKDVTLEPQNISNILLAPSVLYKRTWDVNRLRFTPAYLIDPDSIFNPLPRGQALPLREALTSSTLLENLFAAFHGSSNSE